MRLLDVSTDLGTGATPAHVEAMVKGIRVATDVAHDAETRRIRRAVTEQMKYPTDDELRSALERLPRGDELSPRYRAEQQLEARDLAWREGQPFPSDLWFDYFVRGRSRYKYGEGSAGWNALSRAGY